VAWRSPWTFGTGNPPGKFAAPRAPSSGSDGGGIRTGFPLPVCSRVTRHGSLRRQGCVTPSYRVPTSLTPRTLGYAHPHVRRDASRTNPQVYQLRVYGQLNRPGFGGGSLVESQAATRLIRSPCKGRKAFFASGSKGANVRDYWSSWPFLSTIRAARWSGNAIQWMQRQCVHAVVGTHRSYKQTFRPPERKYSDRDCGCRSIH
jgi:hypothetical protein